MNYLVGGAVRDMLLGLVPEDKDWVVVGKTDQDMLDEGFVKVGNAFSVFLHPDTGEEYALARQETSTGPKYTDFDVVCNPEITLLEDLGRRDLTINAMAWDRSPDSIIDPYNGEADLENKILRMLPGTFDQDPVRALRLARFSARLPDFTIDPDTLAAVKSMDLSGLVPERVWAEMYKALGEVKPSNFFEVLKGTGLFPEVDYLETAEQAPLWHPEGNAWIHTMMCVDRPNSPRVRFAALCHDLGKPVMYAKTGKLHGHEQAGVPYVRALCERLKVPKKYVTLALKVTSYHTHCHKAFELKPYTVTKLIRDINRDLPDFLAACIADKEGRTEPRGSEMYNQPYFLQICAEAYSMPGFRHLKREYEPKKRGDAISRMRQDAVSIITNKRKSLNVNEDLAEHLLPALQACRDKYPADDTYGDVDFNDG